MKEKRPTIKGIALTGDVNLEMYRHLLKMLTFIDKTKPVEIVINSEGGCFYQALAIYDKLKILSKVTPVNITCEGPVMSSGIAILQAGTKRFMLPNSFLMVHYGEDGQNSTQEKKHNTALEKIYRNIISERTNVGSRTVYNWLSKDHYFGAKHALSVGLIDGIVG